MNSDSHTEDENDRVRRKARRSNREKGKATGTFLDKGKGRATTEDNYVPKWIKRPHSDEEANSASLDHDEPADRAEHPQTNVHTSTSLGGSQRVGLTSIHQAQNRSTTGVSRIRFASPAPRTSLSQPSTAPGQAEVIVLSSDDGDMVDIKQASCTTTLYRSWVLIVIRSGNHAGYPDESGTYVLLP
jgi:hypothetical protein